MRVLVCGGRDFYDPTLLNRTLDTLHAIQPITLVIEGEARGADRLARRWAICEGVCLLPFPADWERLGPRAGPVRNERMLREGKPDVVVAFPGGKGTRHMLSIAQAAHVPTLAVNRNGALHILGPDYPLARRLTRS